MAEPRFADDDDLPRTFRREREAREREQRERELPSSSGNGPDQMGVMGNAAAVSSTAAFGPEIYDDTRALGDGKVTVTRFEVPFAHLVMFFIKSVFAAIPALVLLALLLWGAGEALRIAVPSFKGIHITVWQDQRTPAAPAASVEQPRPAPEPKKR